MMEVLVTGASGFLGARAAQQFRTQGWEVCTPSHRELELTDPDALQRWFAVHEPQLVLHCAAVSDTGLCEREPERTRAVNVLACGHLARVCAAAGAKLLLCSSDQVYSGCAQPGPHGEDAPCTPAGAYGRQKLEAERLCLAAAPDTVCLRLSWMYASDERPGEHGHLLTALRAALQDETLPLHWPVYDRRCITDAAQVAQRLPQAALLPGGVYNFGSENTQDTFHTLQQALREAGLASLEKRLKPNREAFAAAHRDLRMDTARCRRAGIDFPDTVQALAAALALLHRS